MIQICFCMLGAVLPWNVVFTWALPLSLYLSLSLFMSCILSLGWADRPLKRLGLLLEKNFFKNFYDLVLIIHLVNLVSAYRRGWSSLFCLSSSLLGSFLVLGVLVGKKNLDGLCVLPTFNPTSCAVLGSRSWTKYSSLWLKYH